MGIAADSLFNVLMSWVRALVNALWALFSAERTTALEFLGKNWMMIAVVIIICGLVIDWMIWLIRWQPYRVWARRLSRMLHLDEPEEETKKEKAKAHAAVMPEKRYARPQAMQAEEEAPLYLYDADEDEASYDEAADDNWQALEAARARAMAEAAEREAYEAEQVRIAQEAYAAEQARRAREACEAEQERVRQEAYEAEQARLAQEEYERQMEEYERQKAQYERDLAEYERQKAEYEAQLAAQQAYEAQRQAVESAAHRRRTAVKAEEEQDTIVRPNRAKSAQKPARVNSAVQKKTTGKHPEKKSAVRHEEKNDRNGGLLGRVAKMIDPEEETVVSRKTLPPRVDMNDAFRTAKLPVIKPSQRRRK